MKRRLLWLVFACATAVQGATPGAPTPVPAHALKPAPQQARAAHFAAELLSRYHYTGIRLDDALSEKIFDQYLKSLDPEKTIFLQTDIDHLSDARTKLDDAILQEDLSIPFAIFNLYRHRAAERFAYAHTLIKKGFDFQKDESYQVVRKMEAWPDTESDMRELWRKRVKNDWLRLKLAGKDQRRIVEILDKRYANFLKRTSRVKSADVFQAYMNAYTMAIEPHTNYMGPRAAENFNISMRLSLVGIGAMLTRKDDYVTIRGLVPGGPAILSGQLKIGDRILGVAQGERGAMTDILGWRLDDAVVLIRGARDSVVVLDLLPADAGPDGPRKRVSLIRKTISLDARAAKASVRVVMDGKVARRVGVISLPSFYVDFAARRKGVQDYRSASRDVARLLEGFKREKVDGVLIDLRNNGGGSLAEAVALTGLFIDQGPVVQQRNARGEVSVESDTHAGLAWDGPLAVLINRGSASASEIFAAALQDYGRGLVIGAPSFGKGTVQNVVDLDRIAKNAKPRFGELRMTVAQFFRVNGGTTQLHGVKPDILFPAGSDAEHAGESSLDNALGWAQIAAADYVPAGEMKSLLPILLKLHETRVQKNRDFQDLREDIAESERRRRNNLISLNEAERRKERDARENRLMRRNARGDAGRRAGDDGVGKAAASGKGAAIRDDGLQPGERNLATELAAEKAREDANDFLLTEAVNIVGDQVTLLQTGARFAVRNAPGNVSMPH